MAVQTPLKPVVTRYDGAPKVEFSPTPTRVRLPNGAAVAALMAAGIGCLFLGLMTTGAVISEPLKNALTLSAAVGPLAGKTVVAVVAYLVAWAVLHARWKDRELNFDRYFLYTMILTGLGFLMTFPTFFEAFEKH